MESRRRNCLRCRVDLGQATGVQVFVKLEPVAGHLLCINCGANGANNFRPEAFAALVEQYHARDKWGGVTLDILDSFHSGKDDGFSVVRVVVEGVPVIIFAYRDQSPQVIQYPNGVSAIKAFSQYREDLEVF